LAIFIEASDAQKPNDRLDAVSQDAIKRKGTIDATPARRIGSLPPPRMSRGLSAQR
jgi:hypothetical protein